VKVASALTLFSLVVLPSIVAAAPPENPVASAQQKLETARANLTAAVQRIEKDPPEMKELDAALAAVNALKDAIDAGAEFEGKDLDFAKSSLAARKELRTQRDYVEQRRANVDVHNARRGIDSALSSLSDRARKVTEGKESPPKDFDDARAAAEALKKVADEARPLGKKDPKFGAFLTEVDATYARQTKAIDDKWTLQSVDKHRALLDAARKELTAALAPLSRESPDPQFKAADTAASALSKVLDDGRVLERDKTYKAESDAARKELAAGKKKMDTTWSETGLARLKAEIEPAHKDLIAAGKGVRAKKPPPEALSEAKTAAIIVRKLVEKFQADANRSEALATYLTKVKATLLEVEGNLEKRSLDSARADLTVAMKPIGGKEPTDEEFQEATAAVTVLEKTLEAVHGEDPAMAPLVTESKAVARDTRATLTARRNEVDVQRQKGKVEEARKVAAQLNKAPIPGDRLDEAQASLNQIRAALEGGVELTKRDKDYAYYAGEVQLRVTEAEAKLAARRIQVDVQQQKAKVEEARKVAAQLNKAPIPGDQLDEAESSIKAIRAALEAGTELTKRDKDYAFYDGEVKLRADELSTKLAARRIEVAVQQQKAKVEEARKIAAELNKPDIAADRIAEAEASINAIKAALASGTELTKVDKDYAYYDREVTSRITELNTKLAARKLAISGTDGRTALTEAVNAAKAKLEAARSPEVSDADLTATAQSIAAINKELDARKELEPKNYGYGLQAGKTREQLVRMNEQLEFAKLARELRRQTVESLAAGIANVDAAPQAKNLRAQKDLFDKAVTQFRACDNMGTGMPSEYPGLEKVALFVDGRKTPVKDVVAQCLQRLDAADKALVLLKPLIAFDEGPKKSFEAGKGLLAQKKTGEAAKQFDECISSGSILKQRNPELKERTFQVAGADITLPDLIAQCAAQSKALKGKK